MLGGETQGIGDGRFRPLEILPDPWALTTQPGDPRVYEVINGQAREEYPSIAHFILLTQGPD